MQRSGIWRSIGPGRLLGLLLGLLVIAVAADAAIFWQSGGDPVSAKAPTVVFQVHRGESLAAVATRLHRQGLIRSALYIRILADLDHSAADIQAGMYLLSGRESAPEILRAFVRGDVATRKLTIPEGYTISDIGQRLQQQGIADAASFVAAATDFANPFLSQGAPVRYRLEGYAFPSTYEVPYGASAKDVAELLFAQWEREFTPAMRTEAASEHLSVNQVVTLASMVEKEARLDSERPKVAAVFLNRMRIGMPLQSDPTVAYALRRKLTAVTIADERYPSPYNTYYTKSLPPGPICNPGLASIQAVLKPAHVGYLYFYGKPDGSHVFSYTYAQQLAAERAHR